MVSKCSMYTKFRLNKWNEQHTLGQKNQQQPNIVIHLKRMKSLTMRHLNAHFSAQSSKVINHLRIVCIISLINIEVKVLEAHWQNYIAHEWIKECCVCCRKRAYIARTCEPIQRQTESLTNEWKKKNKEIAATETATVKIEHFSSTQEFIVQLSIYSKQQKSSRENKITKCFVKSAFKRKTATKNTPKNTEHSKLQATAQNCNMNTKNWKKKNEIFKKKRNNNNKNLGV